MGRRRYSEEHKREAVVMTRLPGATLQQVARPSRRFLKR